MSPQEVTSAQAELNELETTLAALRQAINDGIADARTINAAVRAAQQKERAAGMRAGELRQALKAHELELLRAEQAKAERAKAEAAKAGA